MLSRITLTILLAFAILSGSAQTKTRPIIMLCTDTTAYGRSTLTFEQGMHANGYSFQLSGFDVLEKRDHDKEPFVYSGPSIYWAHSAYLDADRKPLSKNIIVWNTKQVE